MFGHEEESVSIRYAEDQITKLAGCSQYVACGKSDLMHRAFPAFVQAPADGKSRACAVQWSMPTMQTEHATFVILQTSQAFIFASRKPYATGHVLHILLISMALDLDELFLRLNQLNQQKTETTTKMDSIQEEIMHLKDMIVEREERHAAEAERLATVVQEIEVSGERTTIGWSSR